MGQVSELPQRFLHALGKRLIAEREVRTGRAETVQMWGRTESVRREFRKLNALL